MISIGVYSTETKKIIEHLEFDENRLIGELRNEIISKYGKYLRIISGGKTVDLTCDDLKITEMYSGPEPNFNVLI